MRTKKRISLLESQLANYQNLEKQMRGYQVAHSRADQRLDRIGPALVAALEDEVIRHTAGRTTSETTTPDYAVIIRNDPFNPTVTLEALNYDGKATWRLSNNDQYGDFNRVMLEEMEKWTVFAKTGVPVDEERHARRAEAINQS